MTSKKKWLLAAGLSFLLFYFWQWRSRVALRRQAEQALYVQYFDGPVTDYSLAVTRSLPLLHGEKTPDYAQAEKSAALSVAELQTLLQQAPPSQTRDWLEKALALQATLPGQVAAWKHAKKTEWPSLLKAESEEREHLIFILESLRYTAFNHWKLSRDQSLETNALIYSLKELSTKPTQ